MEYLSPVINRVRNNLNTHITIRLGHTLYSLTSKGVTTLDFDMASVAVGTEKKDLFNAVAEGYISVDICVLQNGEYVKVAEYDMTKKKVVPAPVAEPVATTKSADIAKSRGITVKDNEVPAESCTEVKTEEATKADPLEARKNPDYRRSMRVKTNKEEAKAVATETPSEEVTALENVKTNDEVTE